MLSSNKLSHGGRMLQRPTGWKQIHRILRFISRSVSVATKIQTPYFSKYVLNGGGKATIDWS